MKRNIRTGVERSYIILSLRFVRFSVTKLVANTLFGFMGLPVDNRVVTENFEGLCFKVNDTKIMVLVFF